MYSNRPRKNWGIIAVVSLLGISNISMMNTLVSHKLKNPFYSKISFRHANPVGYTNQKYLDLYDLSVNLLEKQLYLLVPLITGAPFILKPLIFFNFYRI